MELDRDGSAGAEPVRAGRDQPAIGIEAVSRGEHGSRRLAGQIGEEARIGRGEVGKVRDDEIDLAGDGVEQVAETHLDPALEPVRGHVLARGRDRFGARIGRPHLGLGRRIRDRDRNGARAGADVDDLPRPAAEERERRGDELLAGGPWAHHSSGGNLERQPVEGRLGHDYLVSRRREFLT